MRLLITGANGQVAQALITSAKQKNIDILACSKATLDITSEAMVTNTIKHYQPHAVINAAAYTDVEQAEAFPELAHKVNANAVHVLSDVCRRQNIPLIHVSTDYVFSGTQHTPYNETALVEPLNVYGASKLAGEIAASTWQKHLILRTSWVFSETEKNFVKTMWRLFHERADVRVVNDQWGGPTSAHSIAEALLTMATQSLTPGFNSWGVYHFAGTPTVSWYEFADTILQACESSSLKIQQLLPILSDEFPTKAKRPAYSGLDMQKIKMVFGIDPSNWRNDLTTVIQLLKK